VLRKILPLLFAAFTASCDSGSINSQQGYEPVQPIAFAHATHAGDNQIACQYCHFAADKSRHAGVPPASVCMNCHTQVKKDSPEIAKIKIAIDSNKPIEWVKVHRLPDYVWFSHQNHVNAKVACQSCHGEVQTMVRVKQVETMSMGWCLDCHRTTLAANNGLTPPTDCAACHH